jgi:hypothetical protein
LIANAFVDSFAGDATTNLYKLLVDTKTRKLDIGVKALNTYVSEDLGNPFLLTLADVPAQHLNEASLRKALAIASDELKRIADWPNGSPDLVAFNDRVRGQLLQTRRTLEHFVDSPPQFGYRSGSQPWNEHLLSVNESTQFRRSVTLKEHVQALAKELDSKKNIWRDRIAQWKLLESKPYIVAARPSPAMVARLESERQKRNQAEAARLVAKYGVNDEQEAIRRYKAEYDAKSNEIEALRNAATAKFIDNPPITADDQIQYQVRKLRDKTPLVVSTFESMTSGTIGLALRLNVIPDEHLVFAALMPQLLTNVGVIENGKPLPYDQMAEAQRKQIQRLTAAFQTNPKTERVELVVRGSGSDAKEAARAVEWMRMVLLEPYWSTDNLPRIRDVVDQRIGQLRRTMQSAEEAWVRQPAAAWKKQESAVYLTASSFLTQTYFAYRLRWMLHDAGANKDAVLRGLAELEKSPGSDRDALRKRLAELPSREFAKDLDELLADIPDESLAMDVAAICRQMQQDLSYGSAKALTSLDQVRRSLLYADNASAYLVGSPRMQAAVQAPLDALVATLNTNKLEPAAHVRKAHITERLQSRDKTASFPLFAGLLAPSLAGGVVLNSADGPRYQDTNREALIDFLAAAQYGGGGSHSAFSRTNAAGLAYSNGLQASPMQEQISYYAERTPEIPQTTRFVVDLIKSAKYDPALAEYAIARTFSSRAAGSYESRAEAMANDLADGDTPEVVAKFRKSVLALRGNPTLPEDIHQRLPIVLSKILPGLGKTVKDVPGGSYFAIGSEKQMSAYEAYLKSVEGPETRLYRLYPRDFWLVSPEPNRDR